MTILYIYYYTNILLAIQLHIHSYLPMEKASPFPANSSFKTATNFSLIFSFCIKKKKSKRRQSTFNLLKK